MMIKPIRFGIYEETTRMNKLFKIHCPYWDDLKFSEKCVEFLEIMFFWLLGVVSIGGIIFILAAIVLSCFAEPTPAPIVQPSKAEQFANELVRELANKDLSVKIVVVRD